MTASMIKPNNPLVDAEALMLRVREGAARLRSGNELDDARLKRWNAATNRLPEIIDRQNAIIVHLALSDNRNQPRTQVPARLAKLRAFGDAPVRLMLRIVNYLFKQQREVDAAQNIALREMSALIAAAAQDLNDINKRLSDLTERLERQQSDPDKT
jgi:hypothetical protein